MGGRREDPLESLIANLEAQFSCVSLLNESVLIFGSVFFSGCEFLYFDFFV